MANGFKNFLDSIIYAGMKPGAESEQGAPAARPGLFARWLNGPAHADPLYVTNQTPGQKVRRALFMVSPMLVVIVLGLLAITVFAPKTATAPKRITAAEVRARVLPDFNQDFKLGSNKDLEITEVHFEHTDGSSIVGSIRNKSDHYVIQATVVFALADLSNSALGGVTVTQTNLPPRASRTFRWPIEQANAKYALVRELDSR